MSEDETGNAELDALLARAAQIIAVEAGLWKDPGPLADTTWEEREPPIAGALRKKFGAMLFLARAYGAGGCKMCHS